jgi:general secretion pathway protein B
MKNAVAAPVYALPTPQLPDSPADTPQPAVDHQESQQIVQTPEPRVNIVTPKPKLTISGIAWQSDSASRIAVVNGRSVAEGGNIDGIKIEQIFPDKVRFSQGEKSFEVPLGSEGQR